MKETDREAWRMIFSRASNEDRHLEGLKPKLFLTADSTRNWQTLAKGEVAQPKTTVLPESDKIPAQNQENRPLGQKPKNPVETDEIPMEWEAPAKPVRRGPFATQEGVSDDDIPPSAFTQAQKEGQFSLSPNPANQEGIKNGLEVDKSGTLALDKPLRKQDAATRKALSVLAEWPEFWHGDGEGVFQWLSAELGSPVEVEDKLLSMGIKWVSSGDKVVMLHPSTDGKPHFWEEFGRKLEAPDYRGAVEFVEKLQGKKTEIRDNPTAQIEGPKKAQTGKSIAIEDLREHAERLNWALPGALPTKVVQSVSDLPESLQKRIKTEGHSGVRGVAVRGNTVYLIADHIQDKTDAIKTWLHEQVGHHGIWIVAQDEMPDIVRAIVKRLNNPEFADIRSDIVELYGLDLNDPDDAREAAEEYIARMAEEADFDPSLWKQVVAWFKKAWRKLTGGDISEDEIRALIRRAYRQLQTSDGPQKAGPAEGEAFALDEGMKSTPNSDKDKAYMDAVQRGDMEIAQRMVDAEARAAGFTEYFRAGESDESGVKAWASFSPDKDSAEAYLDNPGFGGDTLRKVFVKPTNTLSADVRSFMGMQELADSIELGEQDWMSDGWQYPWEESSKVKQKIEAAGFDAVAYVDDFPEGSETIVFTRNLDPENVKDSDPVTRDTSGNVIPLSKRFASEQEDRPPPISNTTQSNERNDTNVERADLPKDSGETGRDATRFSKRDRKQLGRDTESAQDELAMARAGGNPDRIKSAQSKLDALVRESQASAKKSKPNTFIQQQDELLGKLAAARRAGDTKEVERLRTEVEALEKAQFGQSVKRKTNDLLDEEDMAPEPMPSADRRAAVRMVQGVTTNPTTDAATWWTSLKRWLRNFASPLPELPLLGQDTERFAAVRRWFRSVSSETELSREKAKRMVRDIIRPIQELGRDVVDPNTVRKYQDITNKIHAEWVKGEARDSDLIDSLNAQLDEVEPTIGKNPWHLFQNVILWRDLNYRTNVLKTEDGNDITPPAGMTKEEVAATSREAHEAVEASEHKDAIKEALKRHYAFVERMQKELEAHGEVIPDEMKNPDYFPHHILDGWTGKLAPVRATTEGPWRPYMQPITGTEKLHQSDYLAAMYKHASDVMANNAQVALVERDLKPYDIAKEHLAELEEQFDPDTAKRLLYDEKYLPAGYTVIRPSEHLRLSASYVLDRTTLSEKLGKAIAEDEDLLKQLKEFGAELEISAEDIREALTVGEQVRWIVPQEVADVLAGIKQREDAASNPGFGTRMTKPLASVQKLWKMNTLFAPWNWIRYEYGNTMTDVIDKVWGLDPGLAKYLKQSLREVREAANGNTTPEYDAALKEGVMQTVTAAEAEELANLQNFEDFLTTKERAKNTVSKVLTFTTGLSAVRESTFRYAKFLADLDRIKKGERPVYGGAFHKEVEAQQTPEQKAGLISRKSFGDYQDISVAGATFRKYIFPFWSWQEVNLKYHVNLFRNMTDMVKLGDILAAKHAGRGAAVATTRAAVGIVLRLAVARVAIEAWNQFGGQMAGLWDDDDDLEAQLSEADRRRLHIILGKDDKGKVRVVYVPNALADVMEWIGGNNFSRLFVDWASGDISLGRFAKDYAKQVPGDMINKVAQAVRPEAKFAYMMASGKDPFPDVLNQRSIDKGDWYWMLAQAMDRDIAMKLRQELDPYFYNPESAGDWWQRKILQIRRRDPEQWAYFEIRDLAADFKEEKTGKRFEFGSYMSADQKVIRNFRKAIYNADMENAQKFYEAALALGYTSTRFKASLRAQDPLADLNKEQAKEFEASLNPYEKRMLKLAKAYYGRMASGKGQESELFPKKEGRPFTGRPEKLRELIESGRGR
jgi:hypothetical protein